MTGIELIAEERTRQVDCEGWTQQHDRKHTGGQLADAAACYAAGEPIFVQRTYATGGDQRLPHVEFANVWPFERHWYKPKDRMRDLVRAGALIAAEIDRLLACDNTHRKMTSGKQAKLKHLNRVQQEYLERAARWLNEFGSRCIEEMKCQQAMNARQAEAAIKRILEAKPSM